MDYSNIKINYGDTPDRLRGGAEEAVAFLVENLLALNRIEEECSQLGEYRRQGIRIKGMPKDSRGIWRLYKTRYGRAVFSFCTDKLTARGYAQSMNGVRREIAPDGTLLEAKIYGRYAYLNYGCELTVTTKSGKRAVIEIFYVDKNSLNRWWKFTLVNTGEWKLDDIKRKFHIEDRWKNSTL